MKTKIRTHEGRIAMVTGAGQGIGQAIAVALAERGATVIATDLKSPKETVNKIGSNAHAFQLDVMPAKQTFNGGYLNLELLIWNFEFLKNELQRTNRHHHF